MKTAAEYLDAIKQAHSIASDYQLAKILGWSRPRISHYRAGTHHFDEAGALQVAAMLDIDPAEVLIDALESRAHSPAARAAYGSIRDRIAPAVCVMSTSRSRRRRWSDRLPAPLRVPPAFMLSAMA